MSDNIQNAKQIVEKQVDITSVLPIFGAEYSFSRNGADHKCEVVLKASKALPVYIKNADQSVKVINSIQQQLLKSESDTDRYKLTMAAVTAFENFKKLKSVIYLLNGDYKSFPDVTYESLLRMRDELTYASDSMQHTANIISVELGKANTYVYYPVYHTSEEVTEFASVFKGMLSSGMKTADSLRSADYFLESEYVAADNSIYITATLTDRNGLVAGTSVKKLKEKAYAGLNYKPVSVSFEKLLKMGLSSSDGFTARLSTANGKKAMLYRGGESVELFAKINKPGYFFLVGHVDKKSERFSYLIDFYAVQGNRKFIRYVDADEVNKWISLGEFDIIAPFGLETFQMVATMKDPIDMLPANVFDQETELYIVSRDINKGVVQTRALRKQRESIDTAAEDVLIFSTIEK
ncbi:hypothetical protein ACMC5R_11950 [Deferribacteres bacterium DY0037]